MTYDYNALQFIPSYINNAKPTTSLNSFDRGFSGIFGSISGLIGEADSMINGFDAQMTSYGSANPGSNFNALDNISSFSGYGNTGGMSQTDILMQQGFESAYQKSQMRNYYYAQGYSPAQVNQMIQYGGGTIPGATGSTNSLNAEYDSNEAFWDSITAKGNTGANSYNPYGNQGSSQESQMMQMLMMLLLSGGEQSQQSANNSNFLSSLLSLFQ